MYKGLIWLPLILHNVILYGKHNDVHSPDWRHVVWLTSRGLTDVTWSDWRHVVLIANQRGTSAYVATWDRIYVVLTVGKSQYIVLSFDFYRFCVVILFFHPRHNGQILSITLSSYLNSWERASISLFNVQC